MPPADWASVFGLSVSPWELMVRGSAIYWFLFLAFRFVLRRDFGSLAVTDLLLLVIVADAAQNAMAGGYESVSDGLVLVSTILGWNLLLDWAAFRFKPVARFVQPRPVVLVRNGRLQGRALRQELMTRDDLMAKLREKGVGTLAEVERATMEGDGEISVIRRDRGG